MELMFTEPDVFGAIIVTAGWIVDPQVDMGNDRLSEKGHAVWTAMWSTSPLQV
jgi:hypothetical protein